MYLPTRQTQILIIERCDDLSLSFDAYLISADVDGVTLFFSPFSRALFMARVVLFINIIIIFFAVASVETFSNRFLSEWIGLGYSHGGITDRAVRQVAFEYLNVSTEAEFLSKLTFDLWLRHVSVLDQIDQYNDNMDNDPGTKNRPMYHFDAERFVRGNQWLLDAQQIILDALQNEQYEIARTYLGRYLHTHQDFYSHSNWIEMGELDAFNDQHVDLFEL